MRNNIDLIIELDKEIEKVIKKITHGFPINLFKKKIIRELESQGLYVKVNFVLSEMNNSELVATMSLTKNIPKVANIPSYLTEAFIDFKKIKDNPEYLIDEYYKALEQHNSIYKMTKDDKDYEIVIEKSKIKKIEKYLLECMSNEQLQELVDSSKDWQEKLYYYGYFKDGKKPCKFRKQKNGKYYVAKIKYVKPKNDVEYFYICNNEDIKVGDLVMCTSYIGIDMELKAGKVIETNYYLEEELPISLYESKEILDKVNTKDELSFIKYKNGEFYCLDDDGNKIPFFDPNLDRNCYLISVKIADVVMSKLPNEVKKDFMVIPNFEFVPNDFKQIIIKEFISKEPMYYKDIDGNEDEICDYLLFNIKHEDCYNKTIEIVDEILEEMSEDEFNGLLNDTFEEDNVEYIKYIEKTYVKGNHDNIDVTDEFLAKRVFNRLVVKVQTIDQQVNLDESNIDFLD